MKNIVLIFAKHKFTVCVAIFFVFSESWTAGILSRNLTFNTP